MLIEQIIEFELRGLGPLGHTCSPKTGYFHDKTKLSQDKSSSDLLFTAKNIVCTLFSPRWAKAPTKFNPKMRYFKRVLYLTSK